MMAPPGRQIPWIAGTLLCAAAIFGLLLALPGQTVTTAYLNDLFIFLDGAHRIVFGQVPNRDFHTALGPLSFYVPALGYWISGSMGGAMPTAMAAVTIGLALPMIHILGSRLRPMVGIPYGLFLLLIVAVPTNLGESIASLSFAMFYNRIGWAALSLLVVMYLQPEQSRSGQNLLDALCAASLSLVMIYTKATYGLVALAFLGFMLFDARQRRWVLWALGLLVLSAILIEAVWQSTIAHLEDLALAGRVSGTRGIVDLSLAFLRHLADYVLLAIFAVLVLWQSRSLRDLLFFGICAGPGLIIQSQNSQPWGIITLFAGAAVATEILLRSPQIADPKGNGLLARGAPLLLIALLLPTTVQCFIALGVHTVVAAARVGEPFGLPRYGELRLTKLWVPGDRSFMDDYLMSIREGARLLSELPVKPKNVSVLDFANPFTAGLGLPPSRGDYAWLHWGRNINDVHHPPPEQLFGGVDVLMVPKAGVNGIPLRELYGAYIQKAYDPIRHTGLWTVYKRRETGMLSGLGQPLEHAQPSRVGAGDGLSP
ncbi:hypothetical protein FHR70_000307 [Microvirga lupini]|uniref:Glycosyltransferase RgtA/B/C/D-like domain-containing protein n=1 Tax=Microvirga lupini TaxID=420324 RepID=A0A7W4VIN2_9HYPH|nr:hypothetical protein [Microvirga lupini]MBB3017267.1 hypothetical protein [Microvirga lupini]